MTKFNKRVVASAAFAAAALSSAAFGASLAQADESTPVQPGTTTETAKPASQPGTATEAVKPPASQPGTTTESAKPASQPGTTTRPSEPENSVSAQDQLPTQPGTATQTVKPETPAPAPAPVPVSQPAAPAPAPAKPAPAAPAPAPAQVAPVNNAPAGQFPVSAAEVEAAPAPVATDDADKVEADIPVEVPAPAAEVVQVTGSASNEDVAARVSVDVDKNFNVVGLTGHFEDRESSVNIDGTYYLDAAYELNSAFYEEVESYAATLVDQAPEPVGEAVAEVKSGVAEVGGLGADVRAVAFEAITDQAPVDASTMVADVELSVEADVKDA